MYIKRFKYLLLAPLSDLFNKIYKTGSIPDQWKVSKIVPIFKKGCRNAIENYATKAGFVNQLLNQKINECAGCVTFDCKLNWNPHISNCINKAKKSLFTLRLLRKFLNNSEMRILLYSYFYSVLYYNAMIWLVPKIGNVMKKNFCPSLRVP